MNSKQRLQKKLRARFRRLRHIFFWRILRIVRFVPVTKRGLHYSRKAPEPSAPFLFMSNHTHYYDSFFVGYGQKTPMAYLSTDEVSRGELRGSQIFQCVLTEKGTPDVRAVRDLRNLLRSGTSVCVYPEGDRTWDGETDKLLPNSIRLVRLFDAPLRIARVRGAYTTWPRWAEQMRWGKIFIEYDTIPKEEHRSMSDQELYSRLTNELYHNDTKDEEILAVPFRGENLAAGIHNLLWKCPQCGTHDSIYGRGDDIVCRECGTTWRLDAHCRYRPENEAGADLNDWSRWQHRQIREAIDAADNDGNGSAELTRSRDIEFFTYAGQVEDNYKGGRMFEPFDRGDLILYRDRLVFKPVSERHRPLELDTDKIQYYVEGLNKTFNFHYQGQRFEFHQAGKNAVKYFFFLRHIHGFYIPGRENLPDEGLR